MANHDDQDAEDASTIIARSIDNLTLAGVSRVSIGSVLMARTIFLLRQEGWTGDQLLREFGAGIQVPIGRNSGSPPARGSQQE